MIVIGINEYQFPKYWPNLDNATLDAQRLHNILRSKYNFKSLELLLDQDATRRNIHKVIREINLLLPDDNLIIFFAGHGQLEHGTQGYWVPTDGADDSSDYYSNADTISNVASCAARHVLVIADACFAGALVNQSRGGSTSATHEELNAKSSRWVFVSGSLEKVSDGAIGLGSPFSRSLFQCLEENQQPTLAAGQLFTAVIDLALSQGGKTPLASEISCEKNLGGQMVFRLSASANNNLIIEVERLLKLSVNNLVVHSAYITRTVSCYEDRGDRNLRFLNQENKTAYLKDLVRETRKIVLLGSAGSGKSVELQKLAQELVKDDTGFVPFYKRLNFYVDEPIETLLPADWNKINEDRLVLILDGLDEVQQRYFLTAVRRLQIFSEQHPLVRIVVSCRTNFYDFPTGENNGTLDEYSVQILNDVSLEDVKEFAADHFQIDGDAFIKEVYRNSYLDIVSKPYFLNLIINAYKKNGNLSPGRFIIMNDALNDAYSMSKTHFRTSINYPTREHAFTLLEKVAFVMETMGKNFITEEELALVFPRIEEYELLKYLPLFKKDEDGNNWMFAHNNIQEFLASRIMQRQPFQKLINLISIPSATHARVKPTWSNALSFYVSTSEDDAKAALLSWIVANDPEVLIRFETDRVPRETRIDVFKQVFEYYNEKNIWLTSNNFSDKDLARFGSFGEIIDYLVDIIQSAENNQVVVLNALHVLRHMNLSKFSKFQSKVYEALMSLFESGKLNVYGNYTLVRTLADLGFTDADVIDRVLQRIGRSGNQYNRSGLYELISASPHINQYATVFFDGLDPERKKKLDQDRDSVILMDEKWNLDNGIRKLTSPKAIKGLLAILASSRNRGLISNYDVEDILYNIISNAIAAYRVDSDVFNSALNFHVAISDALHGGKKWETSRFFEETHTEKEAVTTILKMEGLPRHRKEKAINSLINSEIVDHIIREYQSDCFSKTEIELVFMFLQSRNETPEAKTMMGKIAKAGRDKDNLVLDIGEMVNWREINIVRAQRSFDLIFNREAFLSAIEKLFVDSGKTVITRDEFHDLRKIDGAELEDSVLRSVIDLFRQLIYNYQQVSLEAIREWATYASNFRQFQVSSVYQHLNDSYLPVLTTKEQEEIIRSWCQIGEGIDVSILWFFVNKFSIDLGESRLLDFTLYFDPSNESNIGLPGTIEHLEKFITKDKIAARVLHNLSMSDIHFIFWISNAGYAIRNNLTAAYGLILNYLKLPHDEYKITEVLESWFNKTGDVDGLRSVVSDAANHSVKWKAVSLLKQSRADDAFLKQFFHDTIANVHSLFEDKVTSANYLMEFQDMVGFHFIADYVLGSPQLEAEHMHLFRNFAKLTNIDAFAKLLELFKIGRSSEFQVSRFNRLDNLALEGIFSIGSHSLENLTIVEATLLDFMDRYKIEYGDLNFMHHNILKMRHQINQNISKVYDIADALIEYNQATN